eukprot:2938966-Rhodomonas_salina.1
MARCSESASRAPLQIIGSPAHPGPAKSGSQWCLGRHCHSGSAIPLAAPPAMIIIMIMMMMAAAAWATPAEPPPRFKFNFEVPTLSEAES